VSQPLEARTEDDDRLAVLSYRVARLEEDGARNRTTAPARKDVWERLQATGPLLTGVVVAIIGYWLTDSVNTALKRQELQLSNAREMREALSTLVSDSSTAEQAEVAALTLAAFGAPAVGPLVTALFAGGDVRAPAAEKALRAVGLGDAAAVCGPMIRILDNRTGRFTWLTHLSAIRLIGDLECRDARPVLQRYSRLLDQVRGPDTLAAVSGIVDPDLPVDLAAVEQLRAEMKRTERIVREQ
jgi:hypothetical protein